MWKGSVEVVEDFVACTVQNLSTCRGGGGAIVRRREVLLGLVAIPFVSGGVGGCSSVGPVSDPTASATASVKRRRSTVVIEPPEGWQLYYPPERVVGPIARVIRFAHPGDEEEGIAVTFFEARDETIDVEPHINEWVVREGARRYPDVEFLGSRYLGGELAAGASFTRKTDKGVSHACQWWRVLRDDGRWNFELRSAPDASVIAPELIAALDTVTWVDAPPSFRCSPALSSDINC